MFELLPFRKGPGSIVNRGEYLDRLFNSFLNEDIFTPLNLINPAGTTFKVDIKDNEDAYVFEADLPGIGKEAIDVNYENEHLTITAKRENTVEEKADNYLRRERTYGELKRSFYVGNIDRDKIKAAFENGVLTVEIPKEASVEAKTKIDIT